MAKKHGLTDYYKTLELRIFTFKYDLSRGIINNT